MVENNSENKENFCASCLALPLAMAGATTTASSEITSSNKKRESIHNLLYYGGIVISVLSIFWFIFLRSKK